MDNATFKTAKKIDEEFRITNNILSILENILTSSQDETRFKEGDFKIKCMFKLDSSLIPSINIKEEILLGNSPYCEIGLEENQLLLNFLIDHYSLKKQNLIAAFDAL